MSGRVRVSNLKPFSVSINHVTTSATPGTYTQLPSVLCDEVVFTGTPTANGGPVLAAFSSSPGSNAIYVADKTTFGPITVPTGVTRNANALYVTLEAGLSNALVISFMCLVYDSNSMAGFPNTAPGSQA
jgi:hypothetical protein